MALTQLLSLSWCANPQLGGVVHPPTLRVRTRGLARISPISVEERDEHSSLEWFGPPERNTLRPLCVVLLMLSRG